MLQVVTQTMFQFKTTTDLIQLLVTIFEKQNQTTKDKGSTITTYLPGNARGISTVEVNTHCY